MAAKRRRSPNRPDSEAPGARERELGRPLEPPDRPNAIERRTDDVAGVVYQLELVKCGRPCWCRDAWPADGHGPYWYAYYVDERARRWRSKYIGREFSKL